MSQRTAIATVATDLARSIEKGCQTRNPSALIRLMTRDAVWRDNDAVHVGRNEIWSALNDKWENALHCTLQQAIESGDAQGAVIRFEAEWQHSQTGRWYRTSGTIRLSLDDQRRIATVESRRTHVPISVSRRRLTIPVAATTESAK